MKTGVFFHEIFSQKFWPVMGHKFKNFPKIMDKFLGLPEVVLIEPQKVSNLLLYQVHEAQLVEGLFRQDYAQGALFSVGGCVEAAEKVYRGELKNALVFNVAAGHHAGYFNAWGGTYISSTGPALANLQQKHEGVRAAIIDTDSHHGDGTREIFLGDRQVLHVCFCDLDVVEDLGTKVDVRVGNIMSDEEYLEKVRSEFFPRARTFGPDIIIHLLGHDTHKDDYGSRGLGRDLFVDLVRELKKLAEEICSGKLVVITMGGSNREVSEYIHPRVLDVLARE
ncbi:arginase family protein [Candidatus Contubernalis alkaliaceticus]|uniref:hypothetical protein n=1 Tax=Candidatus Contubernalis alkaliaceticus TaxID=338645 RepID=UPI001F4C0753|nr:hypothetical protein [Candidatus Contubernalis alkalaceticus]UNC92910.1 histone deacetylase [Candidatus Contubernalis alkalaceticus]